MEIVEQYFPQHWVVYLYVSPDVPEDYIASLQNNPKIRIRKTNELGFANTIHRFFAIDEPDVEIAFFRDADSRLHWKDRWAIREFVKSDKQIHVIRDHVQHRCYIPAGLWAVRKSVMQKPMRELYEEWTPVHNGNGDPNTPRGHGIDQNFLASVFYIPNKANILLHYSHPNCILKDEYGIMFPFEWSEECYCGKVEQEDIKGVEPANTPLWFLRTSR